MSYKKNNGIAILVILIGLGAFIGVFWYAHNYNVNNPKYFKKEKEAVAKKLYLEITEKDYENEYPKTAEEVIEFYGKTYELLYGDMLIDDEIIPEILTAQRKLLSTELLSLNSYEQQHEALLEGIKQLYALKSSCVNFEAKASIVDPFDKKLCWVRVTQYYTGGETLYFNYHLIKEEHSQTWKIHYWKQTDNEFNPI